MIPVYYLLESMLSFQGSFEHLSCVNTVKVFGIDVFLAANKENSAIIARHLFMAAAYDS